MEWHKLHLEDLASADPLLAVVSQRSGGGAAAPAVVDVASDPFFNVINDNKIMLRFVQASCSCGYHADMAARHVAV